MQPYLHPAGDSLHILWNLDASVGRGGLNTNSADVAYVQFYYTLAAAHALTPPDRKAVYGKVQVTGQCSGVAQDPLVQAITIHQKALHHPSVDGRCSVARGPGKVGESAFFILRLGARFADMLPEIWPRLDLRKDCPDLVRKAVQATIPRIPRNA
jgi:hypothetical protein